MLREVSEVGQASGEGAASDKQPDEISSSFSATAADTKMEFLTLRARLHSAESELREKTIMNEKLDEELSKCRAEIGRLRTASRNEVRITCFPCLWLDALLASSCGISHRSTFLCSAFCNS